MDRKVKIGASLACANFRCLERDIRALERAGVDYLHIDVMDGRFVPNFALNADLMNTVKEMTTLPMGVHFMIENPGRYFATFAQVGSQMITIHQEATTHLQRTLGMIRELGMRAGVALNPATPLSALDYVLNDLDIVLIMTVNPGFAGQPLVPVTLNKITDLRRMLDRQGLDIDIQVDGNVSFENIPAMVEAGATMLVGGTSSIFRKGIEITDAVQRIRDLIAVHSLR